MSQFFEYQTDLSSKPRGAVLSTAWSQTEQSILAVGTKGGEVQMFSEEAERLEPDLSFHRDSGADCMTMCWHPTHNLLATGWTDGLVSVWNDKDRVLRDELGRGSSNAKVHHKHPITLIAWTPEGSRLISADQSGLVKVWSCDLRGRLTLLHQYLPKSADQSGGVSHIAFQQVQTFANNAGDALPVPPPFFYATLNGRIFAADDLGHCSEVANVGTSINALHYVADKEYIAVVTSDAVLYKFNVSQEGRVEQERKVKLSVKGDGSQLQCVWAGAGLFAGVNGESMVRLWHLEREENYVLNLLDPRHLIKDGKATLRCIAFNAKRSVLAVATYTNRVLMWRYVNANNSSNREPSENDWEAMSSLEVSKAPVSLHWSSGGGAGSNHGSLLAAVAKDSVAILNETVLQCKSYGGNSVIQMSSDRIFLTTADARSKKLSSGVRIKGLDLNDRHILTYSGHKAEVREIKEGSLGASSSFACRSRCMLLTPDDDVYAAMTNKVSVMNLQGVQKKALDLTETQGSPVDMHLSADHLVCCTSANKLVLWQVGRDYKQILPGRNLDDCGVVYSVRLNCNATKISMLAYKQNASGVVVPESRLFVYDVDIDKLFAHDFGPDFYPVCHEWDRNEAKLLAVEAKRTDQAQAQQQSKSERELKLQRQNEMDGEGDFETDEKQQKTLDAEVTTLFASSEFGVMMQDSFAVDSIGESLMGVDVPYLLFLARPSESDLQAYGDNATPRVKKHTMRDFVSLEKVDANTRRDLLEFSFNLSVGNLDEAYRAVKKISNESIWENMAHMCVKTQRLDVAEVCLGNMGSARGVRAVREAKKLESVKEVQVGFVAVQLGLLDDAERLFREAKRYDLVMMLYQSCGRWKDALKLCYQHDRIRLKTAHFLYAKHLESCGDTAGAMAQYEKSETHRVQVPRMLFDATNFNDLEAYIKSSDDRALYKWWAQYSESNGQYDEALRFYEMAGETMARVRVYCFKGDEKQAMALCESSRSLPACYHLAQKLEQQERWSEAIKYYSMAKKYGQGIRIARKQGLEEELLKLSLDASPQHQAKAAKYFEEKEQYDKAVQLYQRSGHLNQAIHLAFKAQLFDALRDIADNLSSDADPALLARCAEFFLQHHQYEKAAHLYLTAKQYEAALELCLQHHIKISEAMAEQMTPPKGFDPATRESILLRLAQTCRDQGNYHLACKKFTQAGDKVKAMQCLLKSGDNEKIIYYASMTKKREIYILAANYLQNTNWHSDAEIMKTIISFYTKARAVEQLAEFYDACAQVEIDEYRDYEKALGALNESLVHLRTVKSASAPAKIAKLEHRIQLVQRFVEAKRMIQHNPGEMINQCNRLLEEEGVENAVRVGDVFALMAEFYHAQGNMQMSYQVMERMRQADIILSPYLDQAMIQNVHAAMGIRLQDDEDGEVIGEDIPEQY